MANVWCARFMINDMNIVRFTDLHDYVLTK